MPKFDNHWGLENKLKVHKRHLEFFATEIYSYKDKINSSFIS